jgi:uncharacterized protein (DUF427 family)
MGLAWQQGPLAAGSVGRFLVPDPLPERLLYAEPLRRRMRVKFGGRWIADSDDVVLLHEPARYPVAYFPLGAIADGVLEPGEHTTRHQDLSVTTWYTVRAGDQSKPRAAWQHTELPGYASELKGRDDVEQNALTAVEGQTFCPYKGLCSYYDIGAAHRAAWSYEDAWTDVRRVSGLVSFEPDKVEVHLDGARLRLEPGQSVIPHGPDRDLTTHELAPGRQV